jgi:NAD(P)-dependent dehydrogenase (short-subunit alcohol dehydrogenase family)
VVAAADGCRRLADVPAGGQPGRPPLPLRVAGAAVSRLINPTGRPSPRRLEEAVAGRIVLVTGASYGIGEAAARKLAGAGATVLLVARSHERLEQLAGELSRVGPSAHAYPGDLSDPDSVDALAADVLARHGHVDVLVNNAGKSIRRSIERSYDRFHDFQRTIDINYLGPVRLLLALLPAMRERGSGHIVNVSTVGVRVPPAPRWAAYQASKAAFDVFLRSVAVEAEPDGIAATSIYMALVHTRMSAPTPIFRYLPGLRADEAADLICKAIVDRPKTIGPWWATAAELGSAVARRPWEVAMGLYSRMTDDTSSALAAPEEDASSAPHRGDRETRGAPGRGDPTA